MDAETGNALPIPEPNTFFQFTEGSCQLVKVWERLRKINEDYLVENPNFLLIKVLYYL